MIHTDNKLRRGAILLALGLAACGAPDDTTTPEATAAPETAPAADTTTAGEPFVNVLVPLPGMEAEVPEITSSTTILMTTSLGDIKIAVYPEAAPNAAARFIELVESGFYDETPIFRIVPGFVAQFGVNWRQPHRAWQNRSFSDDEPLFALGRGTLAFAKTGAPNSASTQVFINYANNNRLASSNFQTFGAIVEGLDIIDRFVQVGDPSMGLDQGQLWSNGGEYLDRLPVKPTMIVSATILPSQ